MIESVRPQDLGYRLFWFQFDELAESGGPPRACGVTAKDLRDARFIVSERLFARGDITPHRVIEDVVPESLAELPSDFEVPLFRGIWYPEMVPMAGGYTGFARTPAGRALIIEAKPHRRSLSEFIGHRQRWTLCVRDPATDELLTREVLTTENDVDERVGELWDAIDQGQWPATEESA
jgi:hypothetical protein